MDCTICAKESSRGRGFSASRGLGWCLCLRWQVRAGDLLIRRGRPCWGKRSGSQAPSHRRGHWQAWRCERLPETDLEHGFGRVRGRTAGAHPTSGVGGHGIALSVDTPTIPHVAGCVSVAPWPSEQPWRAGACGRDRSDPPLSMPGAASGRFGMGHPCRPPRRVATGPSVLCRKAAARDGTGASRSWWHGCGPRSSGSWSFTAMPSSRTDGPSMTKCSAASKRR